MPFGDINSFGAQFFPIPVHEGGTGNANIPLNALVVGNASDALLSINPGTDGQVLLGKTGGGIPAFATLTSSGGTVTFTPGANSLNLEASGGGGGVAAWTEVTGTSASMAVSNGYIASNAGLVTLTLPATAAVGAIVRVAGKGAGGWSIAQNAGDVINFGSSASTAGVGGSVSSTNRYDSIELVCVTANDTWVVLSSVGNLTVV